MDPQTVDRVVAALDAAAGVRMSGLVVSGPGGMVRHDFGGGDQATDLRSISKVVVALAVGAGIAQGVDLRGRPLTLDLGCACATGRRSWCSRSWGSPTSSGSGTAATTPAGPGCSCR